MLGIKLFTTWLKYNKWEKSHGHSRETEPNMEVNVTQCRSYCLQARWTRTPMSDLNQPSIQQIAVMLTSISYHSTVRR